MNDGPALQEPSPPLNRMLVAILALLGLLVPLCTKNLVE